MLETFLLNLSIKSPAACICGQPDWAKGMILLSAAWASGLSRRTAEMPGAEALDRPGGSRGGGGVVRTARIAPRRSLLSFPHLYRANRHSGKRAAGGLAADAPPTGMAGPENSAAVLPSDALPGRRRRSEADCVCFPPALSMRGSPTGGAAVCTGTVSASRGRRSRSLPSRLCSGGLRISDVPRKRAAQRLCTYRFAAESDGRPFSACAADSRRSVWFAAVSPSSRHRRYPCSAYADCRRSGNRKPFRHSQRCANPRSTSAARRKSICTGLFPCRADRPERASAQRR